MRAELQYVLDTLDRMCRDERDVATILEENLSPPNPVVTKGLTQTTMGAPKSVYNGGLLQARVRYFDPDGRRPGLPPDVAALVEKLGPERAVVRLVNLSRAESRCLVLQAGAFGEHRFTKVAFEEKAPGCAPGGPNGTGQPPVARSLPVDGRWLGVELPASAMLVLDLGMRRFVNRPSYAFPWHGDRIPVPFQ